MSVELGRHRGQIVAVEPRSPPAAPTRDSFNGSKGQDARLAPFLTAEAITLSVGIVTNDDHDVGVLPLNRRIRPRVSDGIFANAIPLYKLSRLAAKLHF